MWLLIMLFESRIVGTTFVDGDLLGNSIVVNCFNQESFGGQLVLVLGSIVFFVQSVLKH